MRRDLIRLQYNVIRMSRRKDRVEAHSDGRGLNWIEQLWGERGGLCCRIK